MARSAATAVENNFRSGYITEASGLNFPEHSCTEAFDCTFNFDGTVERRSGFDFESSFATKTINRASSVVSTYLWKNVAGNGDVTVCVVQVGSTLYFYKVSTTNISSGAVSTTVDLTTFSPSGAPTPELVECQFTAGNGVLFVTHPYLESFYVEYDTATDTATATQIDIEIRDVTGDTADPYSVDERPSATLAGLNVHHKYNLFNQGWNNDNLTSWDTAFANMPSNADIMWAFKNSSDAFSTATVPNVINGNSEAPKGHYILGVYNQDRDTASGFSGTTATTTSYQRVSTCAFFAGRVFYSGLNYVKFNSKIYFSQIIERDDQYGKCYQRNDPTAEDNFDLLPSDGGVININDAGTIYKLFSIPGGLLAFAANGVWMISGSTGLGFTANDYTVAKISSIATLGATSFVDVGGLPAWWNGEGIYIISNSNGAPSVQSLTYSTIKTEYDTIPLACKTLARGYFNPTAGIIQWLYKTETTATPTEKYEFDRILNYNVFTNAFYIWRIPTSTVKVHSLFVTNADTGSTSVTTVVNGAAVTVVDGSGNTVVVYTTTTTTRAPTFKYLVSYLDGANYKFTFADESNTDYVDWFQYDSVGTDYTSYFVTGYKIHADGLKKFQSNWLRIFSKTTEAVSYYFQSIWDYANTGDTGRWSSKQLVEHTDTDYDYTMRRLKIRGAGAVLQFKVTSVSGEPFNIAGWVGFETGNTTP